MTELLLLPDVGRLVVWFLIDQPEVEALVERRVYTDLPNTATYPLVRVSQFPGGTGEHRFAGTFVLQIDAWGPGVGDRKAANRIAETCAAAFARLRDRVEYGGQTAVITNVEVGSVGDDVDDKTTPPKPRSRFTAVITATPAL